MKRLVLFVIALMLVYVSIMYPYTLKQSRAITSYHNSFDTEFVQYTSEVNKLQNVISPGSPDFGKRVYALWNKHDLSNKFRKLEEEVKDSGR